MSIIRRALVPPAVRPTVPPGIVPGERRQTWASLLGKPDSIEESGITITTLTLHASGTPPLSVQRDESSAAVRTVIAIKRDGTIYGYIGLDASDHLVVLAKNGTTVLAEFDTDGTQNFALQLQRDASAGVLPFLAVKRQSTVIGYIGADASDRLALIATNGTTVLAFLTNTGELDTLLGVKSPHLEATTDVKTPKVLDATGAQVLAARRTGWGAPTGTATRSTFDTATVTLPQLAERVKALLDDAATHGLIGP